MPTILLADDSITIQKIVNLTFSGEGIDVVTVGNGDAALKKIYEIHPDVVLADIFMPGKNGYEVCDVIKNDVAINSTPVVLLVGAFEPFDANEAARVKADGHLTKPFEIKVLISAVNALISRPPEQTEPSQPAEVEPAAPEAFEEAEVTVDVLPDVDIEISTFEPLPVMPQASGTSEGSTPEPEAKSESSVSEPMVSTPLGVTVEEIQESMEPAEVAVFMPPSVESSSTQPREADLPPMPVIEESDPLGLLAVDAPAGVPLGENALFDNRSLVVDIWESRPALEPVVEPVLKMPKEAGTASLVEAAENALAEAAPSPELEAAAPVAKEVADEAVSEVSAEAPSFEPVESTAVSAATTEPAQAGPAALAVSVEDLLSDEVIERIANRVVEKLSRDVIERIAWEVVPDLAELMIKEHVEVQLKESGRH